MWHFQNYETENYHIWDKKFKLYKKKNIYFVESVDKPKQMTKQNKRREYVSRAAHRRTVNSKHRAKSVCV